MTRNTIRPAEWSGASNKRRNGRSHLGRPLKVVRWSARLSTASSGWPTDRPTEPKWPPEEPRGARGGRECSSIGICVLEQLERGQNHTSTAPGRSAGAVRLRLQNLISRSLSLSSNRRRHPLGQCCAKANGSGAPLITDFLVVVVVAVAAVGIAVARSLG